MKSFEYYQPTRIFFGRGKIGELGNVVAAYGTKALLVTVPAFPEVEELYAKAVALLKDAGVAVAHFDGVVPNPTTDVISAGTRVAKEFGADVIVGLGGGSSMDTAKAIAVEATHDGTAWDYLFYKTPPSTATLPIVAVSTTSGTGSQTTPCAVLTNPDREDKSAIWHDNIFAKVAIVDPDLPATMPPRLTAMTGFDAFCHNFEAFISNGTNPHVQTIALEAIRLIAANLPKAVADGTDVDARTAMSWADTVGGLAIASAGVTLPHGIGMQISGHCPFVAHGASLAVQYPSFTRFTWESSVAEFAAMGRVFNADLVAESDLDAARGSCEAIDRFLKDIDLWIDLKSLGVDKAKLRDIADDGQVLPDYENNPRIATIEEMYELLVESWDRTAG